MSAVASRPLRTPLQVTLAVWKALFLREAVARLSRERLAWLWVLAEPVGHICILVAIRIVIRQRERMTNRGGRFAVVRGSELVDRLFNLVGLDGVIELVDDPAEL